MTEDVSLPYTEGVAKPQQYCLFIGGIFYGSERTRRQLQGVDDYHPAAGPSRRQHRHALCLGLRRRRKPQQGQFCQGVPGLGGHRHRPYHHPVRHRVRSIDGRLRPLLFIPCKRPGAGAPGFFMAKKNRGARWRRGFACLVPICCRRRILRRSSCPACCPGPFCGAGDGPGIWGRRTRRTAHP